MSNFLTDLYIALVVLISIYGLNAMIMTVLYLLRYRNPQLGEGLDAPWKSDADWPLVAVQLPTFNEQEAAVQIIDRVCTLDYPKDRLIIQVLDDSTDGTTELVRQRVSHYRAQGCRIELKHRTARHGYKAGALDEAFKDLEAEYIAIFDADFVPAPDYLRKILPRFTADPRIGMIQARWGHQNREANLLTRVQALFHDGHHVVEQVARSRSNLLLNFNGTGGVWRTATIRDCGGWQWDTLAEDLDLSYRAQMRGWKMVFLPELIVPGEIPVTLTSYKKQQYRWTFGHIQVFRKLIVRLLTGPGLTLPQRIGGLFHLTTNFNQIAALLMFLLSLPMAMLRLHQPSSFGLVSLASTGPTVMFIVSQIFGYREGLSRKLGRLLHLPVLMLLAIGMTISNTAAVIGVFTGQKMVWSVTPKASANGKYKAASSTVPLVVWLEIAMSIYCAVSLSLALRGAPELIPLSALGMLSYGIVGFTGLVESNRPKKAAEVKTEMAPEYVSHAIESEPGRNVWNKR